MKKLFIALLSLFAFCSCSTTDTITMADISLLNYMGDTIGNWPDTKIVEAVYVSNTYYGTYTAVGVTKFNPLKANGLNFIDKYGKNHFISGGIIVADNIKTIVSSDGNQKKERQAKLTNELNFYTDEIVRKQEELKAIDKNKDRETYRNKKKEITDLQNKVSQIRIQMSNEYRTER